MEQKKPNNIFLRALYTVLLKPFPQAVQLILYVLCPIAAFYLLEVLTHNPIEDIHIGLHIYSWVMYLLIYTVFFFLSGRMRVSHILSTLLVAIVGLANMYTLELRGAPILPWDIHSLGTAVSVLDNQNMELTQATIHILWGFGAILFLSLHCDLRAPAIKKRLAAGVCSAAVLTAMAFGVQTDWLMETINIYEMPFTQGYTYRQNGFLVSFLMNSKYLGIDKPEDYNVAQLEDTVEETLEESENEPGSSSILENPATSAQQPNIIVIMNEAFSDLSVLGDLETNKDFMPYFRSLTENTVEGTAYVSVLGGNTANSEFEFLTGDSMAFLPTGSIPYQQYIKSEIPTLVDVLNDQGYYSIAMHPYYASGWERDKVYDWLGFDEKYFLNDFSGAQRLRQYVSDWGMYQKIIQLFNAKREGDPLFFFGVTMQNHSGYSKEYENFSNDVHVLSEDGKEYKYADTYLSLIAESDRAYEKLISYFTYIEEPTIIVMFGDHQPHSLETSFFKNLLGKHPLELNLEETTLRYQTPFKIWANYDIKEQTDVDISINYLSTLLMKTAGLELSEYQDYLWEIHEQLPVVTANFYMDTDGNIYDYNEDESNAGHQTLLDDYASIQYNHLFDENNRLTELFVLPTQANRSSQ